MIDALAYDKVQNLPIHLGIERKQWDILNRANIILIERNSKASEHKGGSKLFFPLLLLKIPTEVFGC